MGGSDLGDPAPKWSPAEGPFDSEPSVRAPSHSFGGDGRWLQAPDGKWYSFYSNIGPDSDYRYQHPTDPQWWAQDPSADPEGTNNVWACRHGHFQGMTHSKFAQCGSEHPDQPVQFIPATDEEIEAAAEGLTALLASMESK